MIESSNLVDWLLMDHTYGLACFSPLTEKLHTGYYKVLRLISHVVDNGFGFILCQIFIDFWKLDNTFKAARINIFMITIYQMTMWMQCERGSSYWWNELRSITWISWSFIVSFNSLFSCPAATLLFLVHSHGSHDKPPFPLDKRNTNIWLLPPVVSHRTHFHSHILRSAGQGTPFKMAMPVFSSPNFA